MKSVIKYRMWKSPCGLYSDCRESSAKKGRSDSHRKDKFEGFEWQKWDEENNISSGWEKRTKYRMSLRERIALAEAENCWSENKNLDCKVFAERLAFWNLL